MRAYRAFHVKVMSPRTYTASGGLDGFLDAPHYRNASVSQLSYSPAATLKLRHDTDMMQLPIATTVERMQARKPLQSLSEAKIGAPAEHAYGDLHASHVEYCGFLWPRQEQKRQQTDAKPAPLHERQLRHFSWLNWSELKGIVVVARLSSESLLRPH